MNTAHWHLLLNHVPIVGIIIGTVVLIAGFIFKNNVIIKRTALTIIVFSALFAIPTFLTGEGAEEIAEDISGITSESIEKHEDFGKTFLMVSNFLGILAIITFIMDWLKNRFSNMLYILVLVIGIGSSVVVKQVSTSGGEIRHTEIRNQSPANGAEQVNDAGGGIEETDND